MKETMAGATTVVFYDSSRRASWRCSWLTISSILIALTISNFLLDLDMYSFTTAVDGRDAQSKENVASTPHRNETYHNNSRLQIPFNRTYTSLPKVAWLMSFPNSGTTYTLKFIQNTTLTTTATNYGAHEQDSENSISVYPDSPEGPFFRHPNRTLPESFIITKTHCGGSCMGCRPSVYIQNETEFEQSCCLGNRRDDGKLRAVTYSSTIPKSAVHLIRSPFDNIVARLHYEQKKWRKSSKNHHAEMLSNFTNDKQGFQQWCQHADAIDLKFRKQYELPDRLMVALLKTPCYAEFGRYIQWHNNAVAVVEHLQLPTMRLFYENYTSNFDATTYELLDFLQLPRLGPAPVFYKQKHYPHFYEPEQIGFVKSMAKSLATPECWALVRHYFESMVVEVSGNVSSTTD